jgi:sporulation protein YlmC with PRC-barrel domain
MGLRLLLGPDDALYQLLVSIESDKNFVSRRSGNLTTWFKVNTQKKGMTMTDIPLNANVQCSDSACGKTTNLLVNPVTHKVTHIVLEDKSLGDNPTRLVPVENVTSTTQTQITLSCTKDDVAHMKPFITTNFVQESPSGLAYTTRDGYIYPYAINDTAYAPVNERHVPLGELAVHGGMEVEASDGKVGKLDELVLDNNSGEITHIQMLEGHLWGKKDVAIPVSAIDFCDAKTVYLKIDKKAVQALPAVKVRR